MNIRENINTTSKETVLDFGDDNIIIHETVALRQSRCRSIVAYYSQP